MSAAYTDWLVDACDFTVDGVRAAFGFPPLPPQLVKLEFDRDPTVRIVSNLRVQTRRTFHASARVEQDGQAVFEGTLPKNGRVGILPLTGDLMRVRVMQESRNPTARHGSTVTEAIFEPKPNGPAVERFEAPAKVQFGDSIPVTWHAPQSQRAHLAMIEDGGNIEDSIGLPSGQTLVTPTKPGRVLLRLTAENSWGKTIVSRHVNVVPPQLRILLPRASIQSGHPGDEVRFEWRVFGAESVWLIAPECEAPQRVDAESFLFARLGWLPAEYQLIARGYGNAERSVTFAAVPQPFACLS